MCNVRQLFLLIPEHLHSCFERDALRMFTRCHIIRGYFEICLAMFVYHVYIMIHVFLKFLYIGDILKIHRERVSSYQEYFEFFLVCKFFLNRVSLSLLSYLAILI